MSGNTWFDRRIVRFALGLLDEAEEQRFLEIRDDDAACRRAWDERIGTDDPSRPGERHLPPAMVARWPEACMRLTGLERESVALHLERCSSCRDDLFTFGFEPVLHVDPLVTDLPSAAGVATGPATTVYPDRPAPHDRATGSAHAPHDLGGGSATRPPKRRGSFFWGTLTGAGLAAAVAAMVVIAWPSPPAPDGGALPWVAPARFRGGLSTEVVIPKGTSRIALTLGVPRNLDLGRPARVIVTDPDDAWLLDSTIPPERLDAGTVIVLLDVPAGIAAGRYRVTLTQASTRVEEATTFDVALGPR